MTGENSREKHMGGRDASGNQATDAVGGDAAIDGHIDTAASAPTAMTRSPGAGR